MWKNPQACASLVVPAPPGHQISPDCRGCIWTQFGSGLHREHRLGPGTGKPIILRFTVFSPMRSFSVMGLQPSMIPS